MLAALIPAVTGIVVSTGVGVAIDNAVKIILPPATKAVTGFGIKVGVAIAGGIIGGKIANYVSTNLESVITTVNETGAEVISAQEDN